MDCFFFSIVTRKFSCQGQINSRGDRDWNCGGLEGDGVEIRDVGFNYYFYGRCRMKRQSFYFLKFKIYCTNNMFEKEGEFEILRMNKKMYIYDI